MFNSEFIVYGQHRMKGAALEPNECVVSQVRG